MKNAKLMNSQKVHPHVIARSVATKQSHEIKLVQNTRLLRSALNTMRCRAPLAMTTLGTFDETIKI